MLRFTQFWMLCSLQLAIVFADDIDSDYYFGSSYEALRARERARDVYDCKNPVNVMFCKYKCKNDAAVCFESKCYCVYEPKLDIPKKSAIISDVNYSDMILKYSPGRRHHIAHFCPNLDEARKCIRKCMKEGKPAFCGKDHICYCGHSYSHHQKKDKLDPAKINAGFYDLYMKYFGPETSIMESSSKGKTPKKPKPPPNRVPEDPNESKADSAEKILQFIKHTNKNKDKGSTEQEKEKKYNGQEDEAAKGTDDGGEGTDGSGEGKDGSVEKTPDNGDEAETSDKPDAPDSPPEQEGEEKEGEPEANEENVEAE